MPIFGRPVSVAMTVTVALALGYLLLMALGWALFEANWDAVTANFSVLMVGPYTREEIWRVWPSLATVCFASSLALIAYDISFRRMMMIVGGIFMLPILAPGLGWIPRVGLIGVTAAFAAPSILVLALSPKTYRNLAIVVAVAALPVCIVLLHGEVFGAEILPKVPINLWGGLLLTCVLSVTGIVFSYPIGILLALGRTSEMPAIKALCILYIEFIRGVPLISLLFMAQIMLQLFVPEGMSPDRLTRAIITITLFTAAYTAENVRGGLNSIPHGQFEAAKALGVPTALMYGRIILPQALATVIPLTVVQFIGLVIDTSLVSLVGMFDLMGVTRSVIANPNWQAHSLEIFVFVILLYWILAQSVSGIGNRMEAIRDRQKH